jgi:flagellar protein FliO/FliZ
MIDLRLRASVFGLAMLAAGAPIAAEVAAAPAVGVTFAHSLKLIGGMLAVLAVIAGCAWAARQLPIVRAQRNGILKVIESVPLGTRDRMLLVDVEGTRLLIGVGTAGMSCLHVLGARDGGNVRADFGAQLQESMQAREKHAVTAPGAAA